MKYIPFSPPSIEEEDIRAVVKALRSGWLTMGPRTVEFEQAFAQKIGARHAIAVNSCTSALFMSLKVLGIGPGDEVIVPTMTFAATANVVFHAGAIPVLADVDPISHCLLPSELPRLLTKKSRAIIPVHYAGQPADMTAINAFARQHTLAVIEDAAHATGARYTPTTFVGSGRNLTCFSFYSTKNLTTGEGGMITTGSASLAAKLRLLRLHGISRDAWKRYSKEGSWHYKVLTPGYKFNTTDPNSAMGLVQLRKIDRFNARRRRLWEQYNVQLKGLPLDTPTIRPGTISSYHLYPIVLHDYPRDKFIEQMRRANIGVSVHFIPIHRMPYYRKTLHLHPQRFPHAERFFARCVSLPLHPLLDARQQRYIVKTIRRIFLSGSKK